MDAEYLEEQRTATAADLAKSRAADEIVMAVRDGRETFTARSAFSVLAALSAGRIAMRHRDELRAINAELRARIPE